MLSDTNGHTQMSVTGVIIPSRIASHAQELRKRPPTYARLCVQCRAYLPQAAGQPLRWTSDGLCVRCLLSISAALAARKGAAHAMTFSVFPDRLADDTDVPLRLRVLAELQKRGAATEWTPPISTTQLAERFGVSRSTISRALAWGVDHGYLERQRVSLPRGGRGARYRARIEETKQEQ